MNHKRVSRKEILRRGCILIGCIIFFLFLYQYNQIEKATLLTTDNRSFEKAVVTEIVKDNLQESGTRTGEQIVKLKLLTGEKKGTIIEANSSSSYLFGAVCKPGMKVIALVSTADDTIAASVYSYDRTFLLYGIVIVFLLTVWLLGGKKGFAAVCGLVFTFICIIYLFLPMIYRGVSPCWAAILVVAITTIVTMYFIGGASRKTISAIVGTIAGVGIAGIFAFICGKLTQISGYNVSDIDSLVYIQEKTGIKIGELLFAGILIAALGAVMDVAMSIASTIQEIHDKNPALTRKELFWSGIHVGRDVMGTMSNTLVLAFTGGSINTLVFVYSYNYSHLQLMNMYDIGIEIIQGISASMGVILTVPFVAFVSAWLLKNKK